MKFEIVAGDPRTIHRDKRMPLKVRGMFDLILCLPAHWDFTVSNLAKLVPDDAVAIKACLRVLVDYGYARKVRMRSKKTGAYKGTIVKFYENGDSPKTNKEGRARSIEEVQRLPGFDPRPKKPRMQSPNGPVSVFAQDIMLKICYGVETAQQAKLIGSSQRGRIASALGKLRDSGADLNDLAFFEDWWKNDWRSRDRVSKQYQAPRPDQVLEHWWFAIKTKPVEKKEAEGNKDDLSFEEIQRIMQMRAGYNR